MAEYSPCPVDEAHSDSGEASGLRLAQPHAALGCAMNQHHYLGFKQFAGPGMRYVADFQGEERVGWQTEPSSAARENREGGLDKAGARPPLASARHARAGMGCRRGRVTAWPPRVG